MMDGASERAVVTGGSGGIGRAIVGRLLREGVRVVNIDRQPSGQDGVTDILADLAVANAASEAFQVVDQALSGEAPTLFIGCAAVSRASHVLSVTAEDIDEMLAVNVRGAFLAVQAAALRMVRAGAGGSVVLISSVAAEQGWAQEVIYSATKAATKSLVQGMAVELAPFGIRVNAVGPGPIAHHAVSMAITRADPEVYRHELERTPFGRFGTPEEVAEVVALLAHAPWVTGQTLYADGGFLACGLGYFGAARERLTTDLRR